MELSLTTKVRSIYFSLLLNSILWANTPPNLKSQLLSENKSKAKFSKFTVTNKVTSAISIIFVACIIGITLYMLRDKLQKNKVASIHDSIDRQEMKLSKAIEAIEMKLSKAIEAIVAEQEVMQQVNDLNLISSISDFYKKSFNELDSEVQNKVEKIKKEIQKAERSGLSLIKEKEEMQGLERYIKYIKMQYQELVYIIEKQKIFVQNIKEIIDNAIKNLNKEMRNLKGAQHERERLETSFRNKITEKVLQFYYLNKNQQAQQALEETINLKDAQQEKEEEELESSFRETMEKEKQALQRAEQVLNEAKKCSIFFLAKEWDEKHLKESIKELELFLDKAKQSMQNMSTEEIKLSLRKEIFENMQKSKEETRYIIINS